MPQFIPLREDGSKAPAVKGWADADYRCTKAEALAQSSWIGMRADGLVIVDCDSEMAAGNWSADHPIPAFVTTPRGTHYYYLTAPGAPTGPAVDLYPKTDIRAGRGSYVVCPPSPGYKAYDGSAVRFDPAWVPPVAHAEPPTGSGTSSPDPSAGWTTIPEGRRNITMAAFAGTLRKQNMQPREIGRLLLGLNKQYCSPPLSADEIAVIAKSVGRYEPDPDVVIEVAGGKLPLVGASTFGPPPPRTWLWDPYVPDCTMTLVSGRESIGKGLFCAFLAACVTNGIVPGTGEVTEKRPVLWLTSEDHPQLDVWPRLRAAGWVPGESAEVHFMDMKHQLVLPEDIEHVEDVVTELSPGLVIMDPGRSYLGRRQTAGGAAFSYNNEADIRPALQHLLALSAETRTAMVFVAHWKKGEGDVRDMTSGTIAWKQIPRHALDFAESPGGTEHAFWIGKSNGGEKGYVCEYEIEEVEEYETAKFVLGDRLGFPTLADWMDAAKATEVEIDYTDTLVSFLDGLGKGAELPTRDTLAELAGVPQAKLKVLVRALTQQGRITGGGGRGKRSTWQG